MQFFLLVGMTTTQHKILRKEVVEPSYVGIVGELHGVMEVTSGCHMINRCTMPYYIEYNIEYNEYNLKLVDFIYYGYDDLEMTNALNATWAANIFQASKDGEVLREVAVQTTYNNANLKLYINRLGYEIPTSPGSPDKVIFEKVIPYAGYHILELPEEITLHKGEYFSIIIKYLLNLIILLLLKNVVIIQLS